MVVQRRFFGGGSSGGGGGGWRGAWDPNLAYRAGDVVQYRGATFAAVQASTGAEPVTEADMLAGTPADLAVADGGDYEFLAYFQVTEPVRITGLCFYKSSLQATGPHLLSLWDRDVSTSAPIATTSAAHESAAFVGALCGPLVADLVPGRRYAISVQTGAGSDTGYVRTTGVTLPLRYGPFVVSGFGFSTVHGSIASVTTGTTNFWVWPRYQVVRSADWGLVGRLDPAVAGAARTLALPARPDPLSQRPGDGSGFWPDASNTGHFGAVSDYTGGMTATGWVPVQVADGTTITGKRFLGKTGIGYGGQGDNLVFDNCLFEGTMPNDALVQIYCPTLVTFRNCTFKPAANATPPDNDGSVSSAPVAPGTTYADSWQTITRMVPGQTVMERCNVWGGAGIQATGGPDAEHVTVFRGCYIHDAADTDDSGAPPGQNYHHDGLGPDSEGGGHDTLIEGCTIASLGNTQGVALQGLSTYSRVTVRGCYLSGWGYALSLGNSGDWLGSNIVVEDNVWSAELAAVFGPYYGGWRSGSGNRWRRNRFQVRAGDDAAGWDTGDHGAYWWPTDNVAHATDYTG